MAEVMVLMENGNSVSPYSANLEVYAQFLLGLISASFLIFNRVIGTGYVCRHIVVWT